MRNFRTYIIICAVISLASCGNTSKSSCYENNPFEEDSSSRSEEICYEEQEAQMVTCPMCCGTGFFEPVEKLADKQVCDICKGNGVCGIRIAQQVKQGQEKIQEMERQLIVEFTGHVSPKQLDMAYKVLTDLQYTYANCSDAKWPISAVLIKVLYPRMIEDQKRRIKLLETELHNTRKKSMQW